MAIKTNGICKSAAGILCSSASRIGPQLRTDDDAIYRGDLEDFADSRGVMRRETLIPAPESDEVSLTPSMSVEV
jgi:hypothetical protein